MRCRKAGPNGSGWSSFVGRGRLSITAKLFTLEHGVAAYRADFALYACAAAFLLALLLFRSPHGQWLQTCVLVLAGLAGWTVVEYGLHRFILHGLEPFRSWHALHHQRPAALILTPTVFSAALIVVLVFLPSSLLGTVWQACALTCGLLLGYLAYTVTHHAMHHWPARNDWLRRRKLWHARHHHGAAAICYGVTSPLWDHVFASVAARPTVDVRKPS